MKDNTVVVDAAANPPAIRFAPVFNVAVAFIDRHIDEGRAAKVAIRSTASADVTYGELAERVNRCGNVLKSLGIGRGERGGLAGSPLMPAQPIISSFRS